MDRFDNSEEVGVGGGMQQVGAAVGTLCVCVCVCVWPLVIVIA